MSFQLELDQIKNPMLSLLLHVAHPQIWSGLEKLCCLERYSWANKDRNRLTSSALLSYMAFLPKIVLYITIRFKYSSEIIFRNYLFADPLGPVNELGFWRLRRNNSFQVTSSLRASYFGKKRIIMNFPIYWRIATHSVLLVNISWGVLGWNQIRHTMTFKCSQT